MNINYAAFAIAVIKGCLPEPAFAIAEGECYKSADYADDMKLLKQEFTWKEVGELFGVGEHAAFRAVQRKCN